MSSKSQVDLDEEIIRLQDELTEHWKEILVGLEILKLKLVNDPRNLELSRDILILTELVAKNKIFEK